MSTVQPTLCGAGRFPTHMPCCRVQHRCRCAWKLGNSRHPGWSSREDGQVGNTHASHSAGCPDCTEPRGALCNTRRDRYMCTILAAIWHACLRRSGPHTMRGGPLHQHLGHTSLWPGSNRGSLGSFGWWGMYVLETLHNTPAWVGGWVGGWSSLGRKGACSAMWSCTVGALHDVCTTC